MNEFLKLCRENNIDIDGAKALLEMANGNAATAIEFLRYMVDSNKPKHKAIAERAEPVCDCGCIESGRHHQECPAVKPNQDYTEAYKQGVHQSMTSDRIGKHGIVKGPYSDSALYCDHANESPNICPCTCDCYCRVHGNCGPSDLDRTIKFHKGVCPP